MSNGWTAIKIQPEEFRVEEDSRSVGKMGHLVETMKEKNPMGLSLKTFSLLLLTG